MFCAPAPLSHSEQLGPGLGLVRICRKNRHVDTHIEKLVSTELCTLGWNGTITTSTLDLKCVCCVQHRGSYLDSVRGVYRSAVPVGGVCRPAGSVGGVCRPAGSAEGSQLVSALVNHLLLAIRMGLGLGIL